ncbi:DUF3168 domain-containing protein [Ketogulonicigenium vulgare]|uniref:DUF3168 domain-containing protein n=1 Tax=Ketogulonicigenium vulgare (strain WSH-001) TaxID=759362 RepID=F9Y9Z9_KETVW|nr:DUF3168 domain-containing protein [Ketogulonicigenium vulgare]ADO43118.1 conserved hypothetical protein [Ketogulonicigenium vulgare Y25]AEM41410.1 hypothetical protein KVU_1571 [Ketogulonicigenium vulgare WSH-001]ALJ81543.1 hypothetical protein KVH_10370 [Ketogulonicigenium vulgare]ANW35113.1 hypothetical protein KvSKV_10310 [Ketogulonicigenium vulgare]AOZ55153.1 hypothetical protein KVC_2146 [Ketogulonicigenium vulgare]
MSSPATELQDAIEAAVRADAALMAIIAGIYDRVPDRPWGAANGYISFGPWDSVSQEGGCQAIEDVSLQLDAWSNRTGRAHCEEIMQRLRRIMGQVQTDRHPIVARGDPFSQVLRDPNGLTLHGVLRYEFQMERYDG